MSLVTCTCTTCLLLVALVCLAGRLASPVLVKDRIRKGVRDRIIVRPSMDPSVYGSFLNNTDSDDAPAYVQFYFFNIANLPEVREKGAKPVLEEKGPYTYRKHFVRYDISFDYIGQAQYKDIKYYLEVPEMTVGSFDDKIYTLNMALVGALSKIQKFESFGIIKWVLELVTREISRVSDENALGLFTRRSVKELLWGYKDPMLTIVKSVASTWIDVNDFVSFLDNDTRSEDDRLNVMNTGLKDIGQLGEVEVYEGESEYPWSNHAEKVHGTDGTRFPPEKVEVGEALDIWVGQLFRSLKIRSKKQEVISGVDVVRFEIDSSVLEPNEKYDQEIYGLMNVTSALKSAEGAPVFMSLPHFCRADKSLTESVVGIKCDEKQHTLYVDVEPHTGLSLRGASRLMMSSQFGPQFDSVEPNVKETILPIFWQDGFQEATEEQLDMLKDSIYWALRLLKIVKIVTTVGTVVFGILAIVILVAHIARMMRKKKDKKKEKTKDPETPPEASFQVDHPHGDLPEADSKPPRSDNSQETFLLQPQDMNGYGQPMHSTLPGKDIEPRPARLPASGPIPAQENKPPLMLPIV